MQYKDAADDADICRQLLDLLWLDSSSHNCTAKQAKALERLECVGVWVYEANCSMLLERLRVWFQHTIAFLR